MSCPDPYRPYNPFDEAHTPDAELKVHGGLPSDAEIRGLTSALAASGGGAASEDLALDLVLNQIVEQACLATGATGAAIALTRDREMVCRATTGRNAPDLGVRLDNAGFSGECLRVGTLQRCDDTETDPRVDGAACRLLGVRSILVVPLWYWGEFMGIFEIFSPRPNAFGERDEQTLQALAYRIVRHTKEATGQLAGFSASREEKPAAPALPKPDLKSEAVPEPVRERPRPQVFELKPRLVKNATEPGDRWTTYLAVCAGLIACVILGLMVWRLAWTRTAAQKPAPVQTAPQTQELDLGPVTAASASPPAPLQETPKPVSAGAPPRQSAAAADVVISASSKKEVQAPTNEGLAIYDEKGKLIYGTPIRSDAGISKSVTPRSAAPKSPTLLAKSVPPDASAPGLIDGRFLRLKPELAENLLEERVEPDYPDAARRSHIQGSVTLEALIGANGKVQQVTPVSGNPQLADAAMNAVRQWRYKPFTVDGKKVPIRTQVTVTFMLAQ
jgi:TonB family protein